MDIRFSMEIAHKYSYHNRAELQKDNVCGCFYCLSIYSPKEIDEWIDDETTALCPHCGIDSVIGESSGFPLTKEFLQEMRDYWFSPAE